MSIEKSIQDIVQKLDSLSTRLANIESKIGSTPSTAGTTAPSQGSGETSPKVQQYLDSVVGPHIPKLAEASKKIGGLTEQAFNIFQDILDRHEKLLRVVSRSKQITMDDLRSKLLIHVFEPMQQLNALAGESRPTDHFLFVSSLAEGSAALLWPQDLNPAPYVKEMIGASQFHSNKILREFRGVDATKESFANSLNGFLNELHKFVVGGLVWNPNGGDALKIAEEVFGGSSSKPAEEPKKTSTAPAPPAPPSPANISAPVDTTAQARNQLFSELNQGEGITSRLKKVDASMKTKNRTDRTGFVSAKKTPVKKETSLPPQVVELSGLNWILDYVTESVEVNITDTKQIVKMYRCQGANVVIKGKFNGLVIDSCKKTTVVFDEAISTCQLINCQNVSIQVNKSVPSISIDKTSGGHVYLTPESINTQVITSKSDECNISVYENDDWKEFPIPEQFVSTIQNGKLTTVELAHIGE